MPDNKITQDNIDIYLKDLGKEYRRLTHGNADAELVLVGGGAILLSHNFREMTNDIDAMIGADSAMHDAISIIADRYDLPSSWLNSDFEHTSSFSEAIREVSIHYRTFSNVLDVRTVPDEYFIAMKLESGREYKSDFSDVVGILKDNADNGTMIYKEDVENAFIKLYGNMDIMPEKSQTILDYVFSTDDYDRLYDETYDREGNNRELLNDFQKQYPDSISQKNIDDILEQLQDL